MSPRRLLVATAVTRYPQDPELDRPELVDDVARMEHLLGDVFGYDRAPALPLDPTAEQLRSSLRDFAVERCRDNDYVVLYLTGHGEILDSGKHVLLPSDHKPTDVLSRAVKTADIAEWMLEQTPLRRLMIILDCCYAGAGGIQLVKEAVSVWDGQGSLVMITATRPYQKAQPGVFTQAFERATRNENRAAGGYAVPALNCQAIIDRIRNDVHVPGFQTATPVVLGAGEDLHFLPNPDYSRQLVDLDIDTQEQLRREQRDYLRQRFLPAIQWFTGRHRALTDLATWLRSDTRNVRVVTGNPGSGKTALLGLLAALADPERGPAVPRDGLPRMLPPTGSFDSVIYAGTLSATSVLTNLATAAGVKTDPSADLSARVRELMDMLERAKPLTVLIDALDEAADPEDLARYVLRPLIENGGDRLRLVLGTRGHLVPLLLPESLRRNVGVTIDLDDSTYADPASVRAYARRVLLQSRPNSPYRMAPEEVLNGVADAVSVAADTSFLVARFVAQTLAAEPRSADPNDATWRHGLPRSAGVAMSEDLRIRLGHKATMAKELLLPLAYAQGIGLPWPGIWPRLANALHPGRTYTDSDLEWLRRFAGSYIKEGSDGIQSVYRLFHQSLVEHLREGRDASADHASIARALLEAVPPASAGRRDWMPANLYIRTHLASHAARGNCLDDLITDPEYLLTAARVPLLAALPQAHSEVARANAHAYRRAAHHLSTKPTSEHASYLELAAHCARAPHLADAIADRYPRRSWSTLWASWQSTQPHRAFYESFKGSVSAVAVAEYQGRPVVVSAGNDRTVRVSELGTGVPVGDPFTGHTGSVRALAVAEYQGRPVVVSASWDGTVRVSELGTGVPVGDPFTGHSGYVSAVAVAEYQGRPVVVSAGNDRTVRVSELGTGAPVDNPFTGHTSGVTGVAVTDYEGRPVVVSTSWDGTVRVWELGSDARVGDPFTGHSRGVTAVAVAEYQGRQVIVSASDDHTVRVWELSTGASVGKPFTGHSRGVTAVAVAEYQGRQVIVSASDDHTVRVSELSTGASVGKPFTGHIDSVRALAVAEYEGRLVVVSASDDRTVRVWELSSGAPVGRPFTGHTDSVLALAVSEYQGRPVVISASWDGMLWLSELSSGALVGRPSTSHASGMTAMAVTEYQGRPVVVSAGNDSIVRVCELGTGAPVGEPFTGHTDSVWALAVAEYQGRPVVVSAGEDRTLRVSELGLGVPVGRRSTGHTSGVTAVVVAEYQGRRVVISASDDRTVRVWELSSGAPVGVPFTGHTDSVRALAVSEYQGRPVVISASWHSTVRVWELGSGAPVGEPFRSHSSGVTAMAVTEYKGRPAVVSADRDGVVRVWELGSGTPIGKPFKDRAGPVWTVAVTEYKGRLTVVSGGDRRIRIKDAITWRTIGRRLATLDGPINVAEVLPSRSGNLLLVGTEAGTVASWHLTDSLKRRLSMNTLRRVTKDPSSRHVYEQSVRALASLPHHNCRVIGLGQSVELSDIHNNKVIELDASVSAVATASPNTIVVTTDEGIVVLDLL